MATEITKTGIDVIGDMVAVRSRNQARTSFKLKNTSYEASRFSCAIFVLERLPNNDN